jgi:hypothetical protein
VCKFDRKFEGRIKAGEVRALFGAVEGQFYKGLPMLTARCDKPASRLALPLIGTSHDFFAPREGHRRPLRKLRNDRRKMAAHIVPLYPAFESQ